MSASVHAKPIHALHAVLFAFPLPLFLGALFSDLAYWSTAQVQWANFSSWLIVGGLFAGAFVVLWALATLGSGSRAVLYFLVLLAMWLTGFINALVRRLAWHSPLRPWEVPRRRSVCRGTRELESACASRFQSCFRAISRRTARGRADRLRVRLSKRRREDTWSASGSDDRSSLRLDCCR